MFETIVTVIGRLITPLKQVRFADGSLKASGRMACTERRYDRASSEWTDGQTLFVTVVCKRGLAENAFSSLRSGDPVMAHGRLYTREYEKDGVQNTITELEAWSLGPDLQRCTVVLTKKARSAVSAAVAGAEAPRPSGDMPGEAGWETAADGDGHSDDGPDLDGAPSDDPWRGSASVGVGAGEAAVRV